MRFHANAILSLSPAPGCLDDEVLHGNPRAEQIDCVFQDRAETETDPNGARTARYRSTS